MEKRRIPPKPFSMNKDEKYTYSRTTYITIIYHYVKPFNLNNDSLYSLLFVLREVTTKNRESFGSFFLVARKFSPSMI